MYLKQLVLKGFKSFADRSVLSLEPGITAIVGPNGSGKSNISDAVLWVLGERSARNLRGQAMEDIIFAGSAARKAVSVAEVDLVLDNSDHTLPVEFDEVVITRRMYRSGESEYLVNGVVSRRLDVLDILHDTGLGTGTHSIISQGSLDSILQSKPEDRRALIEEAAGVLKHKQRKEKSARKLQAMDNHLARVRDVAAEVKRQLGPLERKAKRAEAYKEVSAQLENVKLALAVHELRELQGQWEKILQAEKTLEGEVEERRAGVAAAEQKVSDFQELMKRESQDATEVARQQRRASNLAERLDAAEMLLRERRRAAVAYEADMSASINNADAQMAQATQELASAQEQLQEAKRSYEEAGTRAAELSEQKLKLDDDLRSKQTQIDELITTIQTCERESDEAKRKRDLLQETLANGLAHVKLVEARKVELTGDLERAQAEEQAAAAEHKKAQEKLTELQQKSDAAQKELTERFTAKEEAQRNQDSAREQLKSAESEIAAIQAAIRTHNEEDPALAWLIDNADQFTGGVTSLSASLKVESSLEALVESLMGEDLAALAVQDAQAALKIAEALAAGKLAGDISLMVREDASLGTRGDASSSRFGHALLDDLSYAESLQPIVQALLGDVVVCADRNEAYRAFKDEQQALRFISKDGFAIWPNGKVRIFGHRQQGDEGVLARERRLDEARERMQAASEAHQAATRALQQADESYRKAQSVGLTLSQELASHKGVCAAAATEHDRTSQRLNAVVSEMQDIDKQVQTAQSNVDELRPEMELIDTLIQEQEKTRTELKTNRDDMTAQVGPLREQSSALAESLAEAKLKAAKFDERKVYAERMVDARNRDIENIQHDVLEAKRQLVVKTAAAQRGQGLLGIFAQLAAGLTRRARLLDEAVSASETNANSVHADAANARTMARKAHDDYDEASSRMSSVRVEKSRLEVQVESAVNTVVHDCRTPLEIAEQMPALEDVTAAEDEKFRLERRIKNMGVINPDAANEYAELKERFDFLDGQLSDMEAARRSLNRIVRVIDERMKDDFAETFEAVNTNFNEIFGLLFPGGTAHLSLVDPDDIENSGVEVTAQPRGKRLTKMMLMSGGEKSLTALALLFAVYKTRTTPFYILDEVEAALDDTNLRRLMSYIDTLRENTQLIMITHQRRTMEMADVLFGVSMQADGVTKVISQKLERALEHAHEE